MSLLPLPLQLVIVLLLLPPPPLLLLEQWKNPELVFTLWALDAWWWLIVQWWFTRQWYELCILSDCTISLNKHLEPEMPAVPGQITTTAFTAKQKETLLEVL